MTDQNVRIVSSSLRLDKPGSGPYWCKICDHRSNDYGTCRCECHKRGTDV